VEHHVDLEAAAHRMCSPSGEPRTAEQPAEDAFGLRLATFASRTQQMSGAGCAVAPEIPSMCLLECGQRGVTLQRAIHQHRARRYFDGGFEHREWQRGDG